ncbi:MarR family winged helix-turn-helix transcriptional regulator [Sphingobium fuliginis]|nr:MarR family transcriptional regulator [Sphingobium fuliginis]
MQTPSMMLSLLQAFYWFDEGLQANITARGWEKRTRAQSLALANIAAGVHRSSQLARNLGVSRQAMSQMIQQLEGMGLINVSADPSDGRAQIITFTEDSTARQDAALDVMEALEKALGERLGAELVTALREALSKDWGAPPVFDTKREEDAAF